MSSGHLLPSGDGLGTRVRVLGYGFGVRGRKVKSRGCALASDLVKAVQTFAHVLVPFFLRALQVLAKRETIAWRPQALLSERNVETRGAAQPGKELP